MKKMSKYLLFALSMLGSMNLSSLPSQAIGSMPPFGLMEVSDYDGSDRQLVQQNETVDFQGEGYPDFGAPRYLDEPAAPYVETNTNEPEVENVEEAPVVAEESAQSSGAVALSPEVQKEQNEANEPAPVEAEAIKPVEDGNIDVKDDVELAPVEVIKPVEAEKLLDESKNSNVKEVKPQIQPSEVKDLPKPVNADEMKNMMSKKVVKSVVDYIPYVVAFAKAKEAYRYLEKERAFDLPHKAYRDLTLLPQYNEVKMFTTLLCDVFDVDAPSEDKMVKNYKAKLPNLIVANKYLNNILDDLYDCKKAQKEGSYELKLSDLNFVNRLLISATSNDSDDSSTLPEDKKNNRTVLAVNDEEKKVAKKLFGEKIGSTVSNDENKDTCAKTVLRKIAKDV